VRLTFKAGCAVLVLSTACAHFGDRELASPLPHAAEVSAAMNSAVIPQIDLQRVPAGAAVKAWAEASRAAQPRVFNISYAIVQPTAFTVRPMTPQVVPEKQPTVTVRRKKVTSRWLLNEICRQTDWYWVVRGRTILIGPRAAFPKSKS